MSARLIVNLQKTQDACETLARRHGSGHQQLSLGLGHIRCSGGGCLRLQSLDDQLSTGID